MKSHRIWAALAGIFLVILGGYLFVKPQVSLLSLSWLLALAFLVGAIADLVFYLNLPKELRSIWHLIGAILTIIIGVYLLAGYYFVAFPIVIPTIIGIWFIVIGILRLFSGPSLADLIPGFRSLAMWTGILMILLGIFLILYPMFASLTVAYVLAVTLIYQGIVYLIDAFKRQF